MLKIIPVSPLEKILSADGEYSPREYRSFSMLKGERASFQVAVWNEPSNSARGEYYYDTIVELDSPLAGCCSVSAVEELPSSLPAYADHDDDIITDRPGLFPELLRPIQTGKTFVPLIPLRWKLIWVELDVPADAKAGSYDITVRLSENGNLLGETTVSVKIINAVLPEQKLRCINWFHCDCIASYYKVPVFSEEHWTLMGRFMATASRHGVNAILTPIFTPPLDTDVGGERPTVQLIDVTCSNGVYSFGFDKFDRYVALAHENGMKYFEISHLFTQWGAAHAPKIMATVDGEYKRIFGWDTDATGDSYVSFLRALAPKLVAEIDRLGIHDECYFHVSDEPSEEVLDNYSKAASVAHELFAGFKFIDALSSVKFYDSGLVQIPVPATNHIQPFLERDIPERWCYYCCGQTIGVSNRFFAMSSRRNRIIGLQMYKYDIAGFLQWGYNFWYARQSRGLIDPFSTTDGNGAWPSGDPFVVYPGSDGYPLISLRLKVFYDAIEDQRACRLLETLIGREKVVELIDEGLDEPLRFDNGPRCDCWLLSKREKINELIEQNI